MSFHLFIRGSQTPYDKWRRVEGVVQPAAFDEKSRDQGQNDQQDGKDKEESSIKKLKETIIPIVASQIMSSPVITLSPDAPLEEAWDLFDKKRFRQVPIISTNGKIIGILSDRTILHETGELTKHPKSKGKRKVGEFMEVNVLCAELSTDVSQIAKLFIEEHVGAMPIIDNNGELKGMVTRGDILRTIIKIRPPEFNF